MQHLYSTLLQISQKSVPEMMILPQMDESPKRAMVTLILTIHSGFCVKGKLNGFAEGNQMFDF